MLSLKSKHLRAAEYDPLRKQLLIAFTDGKLYRYENVSQEIYVGLVDAPSKSQYFRTNLKKHKFTRVQ